MTLALTAPFPYFGGKSGAAPIIWRALGDPGGYIEPFAGSAATLGYNKDPHAGRREKLWLSPACHDTEQPSLFEVPA